MAERLGRREARFVRAFFVLVAIPLLVAFPYVRALNNPNELVRVYTVMALAENHTYRVDEQVENLGHTEDLAHVGGHYVMVKAPGAVHLGLPAYFLFSRVIAPLLGDEYPSPARLASMDEDSAEWARLRWTRRATWTLRLVTSQLPCFLFLIWFERYLRAYSRDTVLRLATVVAAGLGTNFLAYAHMFASHSLYAVFAFLAFGLMAKGRRSPARAAIVGFLVSGCVALEYQALFPAVVLGGYAFWGFRPYRSRLLAGAAANVPFVMWFQYRAYGNAFLPGHKLIENAKFAAEHRVGLFGVTLPSWTALRALAVDPGFGFFGLSPFMWLGLAAIPLLLLRPRRRGETAAWSLAMAAVVLVNAGFVEWRAGWTVGPRYLVVCAPFFAFGGLSLLERFARLGLRARAVARGAAIGLCFAGVVAIGSVGLIVDTLPDTIGRPFAQFFVPMLRAGYVAHDVGEWFGGRSGAMWYFALAVLLVTPLALLARARVSVLAFVMCAAAGLAIPLAPDAFPRWELHPSTAFFAREWEPR